MNIINLFAGDASGNSGYSGDGGVAILSKLHTPTCTCTDLLGNVYITDYTNNIVRVVNSSGIINNFAGIPNQTGYTGDGGLALSAKFKGPSGICNDTFGNIYVSDVISNVVRKINPSGIISRFAGNVSGISGYSGDGGNAIDAQLYNPYDVCSDLSGNIYIADTNNYVIRVVDLSGIINTYAGNNNLGNATSYDTPIIAKNAFLLYPKGICSDNFGNIYIADNGNNLIGKVDLSGIISIFAGTQLTSGYSGDNGPANSAYIYSPLDVCSDIYNNIYIADSGNNVIRKVNSSGIITTVAGTTSPGYSGNNGDATLAKIQNPTGICSDASGNIYIAESTNNIIRKIDIIDGSTPCYPEDSIIYANNKWMTVKDLKEGDILIDNNCNTHTCLDVLCFNKTDNFIKLCSNNCDLYLTPGHPILFKNKEIKCEELEFGIDIKTDKLIQVFCVVTEERVPILMANGLYVYTWSKIGWTNFIINCRPNIYWKTKFTNILENFTNPQIVDNVHNKKGRKIFIEKNALGENYLKSDIILYESDKIQWKSKIYDIINIVNGNNIKFLESDF